MTDYDLDEFKTFLNKIVSIKYNDGPGYIGFVYYVYATKNSPTLAHCWSLNILEEGLCWNSLDSISSYEFVDFKNLSSDSRHNLIKNCVSEELRFD